MVLIVLRKRSRSGGRADGIRRHPVQSKAARKPPRLSHLQFRAIQIRPEPIIFAPRPLHLCGLDIKGNIDPPPDRSN